jgi:hypothetical protein
VVLLGAAALLWRAFPHRMGLLTRGLTGDLIYTGEQGGRRALEQALTQPVLGTQWGGEMTSAIVAMVVAGLFALPVAWIYILIRQKKGFRQSLVHSLVMLAVVVAGVVVLVKNSLALAFSLAGIVAAVRFRNTLEDSKDAVYIFLATGIGLAAGVNLPVAAALSLVFNVVAVALWYTDLGRSSAALEGAAAERRLQQLRAHVDRPSGFVQRLDEEILKSLSAEQLDALASRAWRLRRRHAPSGRVAGFDSLVRIRTTDLDGTRKAVAPLMDRYLKRWKEGAVEADPPGGFFLEYAIQLKKSTNLAELAETLGQAAGVTAVEIH